MSELSPFFPGTQIRWLWSASSIGLLKECAYKYYLSRVEGWTEKGERAHLDFGTFYHHAVETYDRAKIAGLDHETALFEAVLIALRDTWIDGKPWRLSKTLDASDNASLKCRENLIRTIVWYLDKYRHDTAKTLVHDGKPLVEQHFQLDIGDGYALHGYLDKIVEFQGLPFVMDRKTTGKILSEYYFRRFDPDNQISLYTFAAQVIFKNPIKGVIIDAAQVAVGFSRFDRKIISKDQGLIDEWLGDLREWLALARSYAERGVWPRNDKSCTFCCFRHICTKSPGVRQKFLETEFEKTEWNPLTPR